MLQGYDIVNRCKIGVIQEEMKGSKIDEICNWNSLSMNISG